MPSACGGWSRPLVASRRALGAFLALGLAAVLAACRTLAPPDPARIGPLAADAGELLLVGFRGTEPAGNEDLDHLLCEAKVGGIILFAHNIVDHDQIARLTRAADERALACTGRRLLVAIDAEGGSVMRLGPKVGYTPTLSAEELGQRNDLVLTELEARRIGTMLREAGIRWNLAPVVDVGFNPANPVIVGRNRSYGDNAAMVIDHARAFIRGMHEAGVVTTLKHFPGHGSSFTDSHKGFVDVTDTANLDVELKPYRVLMAEQMVDTVMTAHVFNRSLDRRRPATLSRPTIDGLLRGELGWRGVVVSDDMRMGAIEQHYGLDDATILTLAAGVDVVLIAADHLPDGRSASTEALAAIRTALARGRLDPARIESALARIRQLKSRMR
ncbi:MAG: glycoside hydrolase family 3 [Candidatus Rokuibacteriota bacterium]|nr:MAG: glycoside hydrolase family 3 [Candidatus Rokubacteria bacterium]PYO00229.1 MAG: glycoside hydrolase family 3 [Candidatus Rokubacteria bacterium]